MSVRILLADDHPAYRQALRLLLDRTPGLLVVTEAPDGGSALRQARVLAPDLVLMDVMMPGMNGIETTRRLLAGSPRIRVLALSMHAETSFVEGMLAAGASGYALKDDEAAELIRAILQVAGGNPYLSPSLARLLDPPGGAGT